MKKLYFIAMLTALIVLFFSLSAFAATSVELTLDTPSLYVLEDVVHEVALDKAPYIKSDRTMVPVRALCEAFGNEVSWDEDEQLVTITDGDSIIRLTIGGDTMEVNGRTATLDAAAEITDGRTFLPLRAISENLGYFVYYTASSRQIFIDDCPPLGFVQGEAIPYSMAHTFYTLSVQATGRPDSLSDNEKQLLADGTIEALVENYKYAAAAADEGLSLSEEALSALTAEIENNRSFEGARTLSAPYIKFLEKWMLASDYQALISARVSLPEEECLSLYNTLYVCVKHILITSGERRTEEEAAALADEIYEKAAAGMDFDMLIATYNEDPGMASRPGGYIFTTGEMVKEFEETSFALAVGEISPPVKTAYGYHILCRLPLPQENASSFINTALYTSALDELWEQYPAYQADGLIEFYRQLP